MLKKIPFLPLLLCTYLVGCQHKSEKKPLPPPKDTTISRTSSPDSETNKIRQQLVSAGYTVDLIDEIPAGSTYTVKLPAVAWTSPLKMGDNARIIVDPNLTECKIIILDGTFGENCVITSSGAAGANQGPNPNDCWIIRRGWCQASSNTDGATGINGLKGGSGANAIKLTVDLGISSVKSVYILGNGGPGGVGGVAGTGEYGGSKRGPFGHHGRGGQGGKGGDGGDGGNANDVFVRFWMNKATSSTTGAVPDPEVNVDASGGAPGQPGAGGAGGAHDGGGAAPAGPFGSPGKRGKDATHRRELIIKPSSITALLDSSTSK